MSKKIQVTLTNAILVVVAALLLLGIVGIKAYRSGVGARSTARPPPPRSQSINVDPAEVGAELNALRDELKGLKGPVQDLMDALDELATEAPQAMPFTRLQYHKSVDRSKTILVVVPDADANNCRQLVNSVFEKATNKFQIRVGLVEITDEDAPPAAPGADRDVVFHLSKCVDPKYALCNQSKFCPTDFIRIRQISKQEISRLGKGHSWLAHIGSMVYRKEEYVLFVDNAASVFEEGWDEKLITDLQSRKTDANSLVALSGRLPDSSVSHFSKVCVESLDASGLPVLASTQRLATDAAVNTPQSLVTTEFLFTEAVSFFINCPLDRHLDKISTSAHDVLLSARLLGLGYSIYLPKSTTTFYRGAAAKANDGSVAILPVLVREAQSTSASALSSSASIERFNNAFFDSSKFKDIRFRIAGNGVKALEAAGIKAENGKLALMDTRDSRCSL
eukprot:GILI01010073.1.p1 GENE.GILI01010073.1~~GILI01010073.1.p1  ORF type:complete len:473 (-),score=51.11 GILI01010073.1:111-1457(-)